MPLAALRWAICRFRFHGPFLILQYSDSLESAPLKIQSELSLEIDFRAILPRLRQLLAGVDLSDGRYPSPIAVYYSFPAQVALPNIETAFLTFLEDQGADVVQAVRLSRGRPLSRTGMRLPLNILAAPEASALLEGLDSLQWLKQPLVRSFGIHAETLRGDMELTLRAGACSILIASDVRSALPVLRRLPEAMLPRLVVQWGAAMESLESVPGVAFLEVEPEPLPFVHEFLMGLTIDMPLHQAFRLALRKYRSQSLQPPRARLSADPFSNQSLRLSDALLELKRRANRFQAYYGPPLPSSTQPASDWRTALPETSLPPALRDPIFGDRQVLHHQIAGLVAVSGSAARFEDLVANLPTMPAANPEARRALDAALVRVETEPLSKPMHAYESLEAGAAYELQVHIGSRLPESLVAGGVAAIDELVGPPDDSEGHWLDLSVQAKDFRLLSPAGQRVRLPRRGSSDLVYFRIRAPLAPGTARLRITIHHRNRLIQSFLLKAVIAAAEAEGNLEIAQEFAVSQEFANLDELQPRALFIGLNQGRTTHELMIKSDQATSELDLSASAYDQAVKDLRKALEDAVVIPGRRVARKYQKVVPGNAPGAEASDAFRALAKLGRAVYEALFSALPRGAATRQSLVRLQATAKEKIQVVRFDPRSAFPWTLLYDWELPAGIPGTPPPPVCLGVVPDASGNAVDCAHGAGDKAYCVRGFWGVRHYVEEMLNQQRNASQTVKRPAADVVRIVADSALTQAKTLQTHLTAALGTGNLTMDPGNETKLLDLLWQTPSARPAVLIVLGHLETGALPGEPDTPRVEMQSGQEWFTLKNLTDRSTKAVDWWDDPRTIVLFAACQSAATDQDALNDFVTALNTAGAGAIIGTQSVIGGDQAADFAERITRNLWAFMPLGEAIHAVRSETVRDGDPGGFLLQSFGDIDLKLQ
jgi:hypothetical protein